MQDEAKENWHKSEGVSEGESEGGAAEA